MYVYSYVRISLCLINVICFSLSFSFNLIITHTTFFHCFFSGQMFSLRVLLSFYWIFCQFQPGVVYKSNASEKSVYSKRCHHLRWSFFRKYERLSAVNFVHKKLHLRYLTGFWIRNTHLNFEHIQQLVWCIYR